VKRILIAAAWQPCDRHATGLIERMLIIFQFFDHHRSSIVRPGDQIVDREPPAIVKILLVRVEPELDAALHPLPALQRMPFLALILQRQLDFLEQLKQFG